MALTLTASACASASLPEKPASSYGFEPYPGSRWTDPQGQVVTSPEILNVIQGPEHCEWDSAAMLHVGWPLGHESKDMSEARQYVRDPEGVLPEEPLRTSYDGDVALPDDAKSTGYRTPFMELWLGRDAKQAAYLVFSDHTELWPRTDPPIACA